MPSAGLGPEFGTLKSTSLPTMGYLVSNLSAHCAPHLHVHAAAATPNLRHVEWFHDHVRVESMVFDGTLDPSDGTLHPDDAPGNGLTLKRSDVEQFRVDSRSRRGAAQPASANWRIP